MAYYQNQCPPTYFGGTPEEAKKFIEKNIEEAKENFKREVFISEFNNPNIGFNRCDREFPDAATLQNYLPKSNITFN
ncbi:hypothetical protein COV19_01350 [Candidatus Woesearchaeota archaeon CG10_big_fil_rev_8_21_14_0_10_44_13]|nr:MAG: hypothetical protein COV19_01350 [Candidatus Woesearchaeota archaeon CG10_big_fil_rev_8_21_14_0_10_44_13]